MDRDTELLKIQIYSDAVSNRINVLSTYAYSILVTSAFTLFILYFEVGLGLVLTITLMSIFCLSAIFMVYYAYRIERRKKQKIQGFIDKVNSGEPLPDLDKMGK